MLCFFVVKQSIITSLGLKNLKILKIKIFRQSQTKNMRKIVQVKKLVYLGLRKQLYLGQRKWNSKCSLVSSLLAKNSILQISCRKQPKRKVKLSLWINIFQLNLVKSQYILHVIVVCIILYITAIIYNTFTTSPYLKNWREAWMLQERWGKFADVVSGKEVHFCYLWKIWLSPLGLSQVIKFHNTFKREFSVWLHYTFITQLRK